MGALLSATALAECTTNICVPDACLPQFPGDCCTIAGTHLLDDVCVLDFGPKTVTVAGSATLKAAVAGGSFAINAGDLIVQGLLQAPGGSPSAFPTIGITVTGAFETQSVGNSPGTINVKANGPTDPGSVDISALGSVQLLGKDISADGGTSPGGGSISVSGTSIAITSPVHANGTAGAYGGDITFEATTGGVTIDGAISSNCSGTDGLGGSIYIVSAGAISVTAPLQAKGTMASSGGYIGLAADGDVTVAANVTATASGKASDGGSIEIQAGFANSITINSTLDVRSTTANGDADGWISVGPACAVIVPGTLNARNDGLSQGTISITYNSSFDATGGTLLADDPSVTGGTFISCRCLDADFDGQCDTPLQCASAPVFTNATVNPAATYDPLADSPCACGNGVIDPEEQCDDGNQDGGDCCSDLCRFDPSGTLCADDGNDCTADQCDGTGSCLHTTKPSGAPCSDDGDPCTSDQCDGTGGCLHSAKPSGATCRDDGNPCTTDQCDAAGACVHTVGNAGAVCRSARVCQVSATCTGTSADCPPNGVQPDGTPCNDSTACTTNDVCSGGACIGDSGLCPPCCTTHGTGGCNDTTCQACVCDFYPPCCSGSWSSLCVLVTSYFCSASCPPPCGAAAPTPTRTASFTPLPLNPPTDTPAPTETSTPANMDTPTTTASPTDTPASTATTTPTDTAAPTETPTATQSVAPPPSDTPTSTDTPTPCPVGTPCAPDFVKVCQPPNLPPGNICDCTSCQPCPPCPAGQINGCVLFECGCVCVPATPTATPTPTPTPASTPTARLDHFSCYAARITPHTKPFTPVMGVSLIDEFGAVTIEVHKPVSLCGPANLNGGDAAAPTHLTQLTRYQINLPKAATRFAKIPHQTVVNEFGMLLVDLIKPTRLLIPSAKSLISQPAAPVNPPVDHFKCYRTRVPRGAPKFMPIRGATTVADQFGTVTVDVTRPTMLCAPVNQNGEEPGVETHATHLMCYKVRPVPGSPRFHKITPVFVTDQLALETLDVVKPVELCVPSLRNP